MSSCPECGSDFPAEANFCRSCGSPIGNACGNCGASVPAHADYCPDCGEMVDGSATTDASSDDGILRLRPREFARRLTDSDLKADDLLNRLQQKKQVKIEAGNRAYLLENGKPVAELPSGRHTIDSLGQKLSDLRRGRDYRTVLIEDGETVVTLPIDDIRTASEYPVDIVIELAFRIDDAGRLFSNLMADRDTVTASTFEQLLGDAIKDELQATISTVEHDELYGNRKLKRQLREDIETQCRGLFERNGLELVELRSFEYDDDRDEVRESKKKVQIRTEQENIEDEKLELDKQARERATEDMVHEQNQRVRKETAKQSAEHEIETQDIEHDHEKDDKKRRHRHKSERENVEHSQEKKTRRKEGAVERRDIEHEQDLEEMEDLIDIKAKKDQQKLDREQRNQDLEMRKEEHEVEVERERLQAREDVDLDTLSSIDGVNEAVSELAEIEKAADLSPAQLEALGAQDSDELAKARQEAHNAEKERERLEDQKQFREDIKQQAADSMDRMQDVSESAMDNVSKTGQAAAEDTSDNVIVSDAGGSSDDGDTTIVQGSGGGGGDGIDEPDKVIICPECREEMPYGNEFCTNCGTEF